MWSSFFVSLKFANMYIKHLTNHVLFNELEYVTDLLKYPFNEFTTDTKLKTNII